MDSRTPLSVGAKTAIAIILAGILIAVAIYLKPVSGRYVVTTRGNEIRRLDTVTGELIACRGQRCAHVTEKNGKVVVTHPR